ncbi:MAG TPA: sigma-70 family RNA polymerase sigma factor [Thermoleophilaceae bacterium]|jgi:RNA polymerase sigma factor (sigma-70 family)
MGAAGQELGPEEIAELLERWRPEVLRRMRGRRLWCDLPPAEHEDQFQDVAMVLCTRRFRSEEHVRRALWTGLGFRAKDFWKAGRRRELSVGELFEQVAADERADGVEEAATVAADSRVVDDCLSELDARERAVYRLVKGDELSRRSVARRLCVSEADVLRSLYSAQRKIDQVAVLLVGGVGLCGRRRRAVQSLARGQARGLTLEQARAHLARCPDCLLAFREQRAALSRDVAAALPIPAAAAEQHATGIAAVIDHVRGLPGAAKRQVYDWAGRSPSGADETIAGAGGLALSTKVAVTLCVGAAAGGGAVCVNQLGVFPARPDEHQTAKPAKVEKTRQEGPVKAAQAAEPQPPAEQSQREEPVKDPTPATSSEPAAQQPVQKTPPQEFFGGGNSGGSSGQSSSSSGTAPSSPSGSAGSSSQGGGGSGGEFFGE